MRTRNSYDTCRKLAVAIIGADLPIRDFARAHCRDFIETLRFLPKNANKRFPRLSPRQAAEKARDGKLDNLISSANVNAYLTDLSSFLNWAVQEEYLDRNPARGLRLPDEVAKRNKRFPFSPTQLKKIFNAPLYRGCVDGERGYFLSGTERPQNARFCTHATFRFAVEQLGVEAFDGRLIAVDEFHHVSASADNRLGSQLAEFIARDKAHIVAMTGSYFRGDAVPVLMPEDEAKFETVTYTYYEQLNGYEHLKALNIGYFFYSNRYLDAIEAVLDPAKKTIVHIPSVNSRESTKDKTKEVEEIMEYLGEWQGADPQTGLHRVKLPDGRVIKIADLVDDSDSTKRGKVLASLKDPAHRNDRDHVDIIIALGMAKEGFDWIWCEHALTVGYRSSLTEIIQIIGRATRDAPGKETATFTNLIAEPDASEAAVVGAINDTLKAIAASLLMEQVLAPRFTFTPKDRGPLDDFEYEGGYQPGQTNARANVSRFASRMQQASASPASSARAASLSPPTWSPCFPSAILK